MRNFCDLIGLEQWYFSLIWNTYPWKLPTFCGWWYKQIIAWFVRDIWHKYHLWYFKIVSNFTRLLAREITYNNFEISLVVFMPNITTNHAITYTNNIWTQVCWAMLLFRVHWNASKGPHPQQHFRIIFSRPHKGQSHQKTHIWKYVSIPGYLRRVVFNFSRCCLVLPAKPGNTWAAIKSVYTKNLCFCRSQ